MITKEAFVAALRTIKGPESRWQWKEKELGATPEPELDLHQAEYLSSQLALLRAAVPDPHNYVERWLFEALDPIPQKDDTAVTVPGDDPGALYDLLMREASELPEEELPLRDLPMTTNLPHKAISAVDFTNYIDAVISYAAAHDVIIHIVEDGKEDKLLIGIELFQRLCAAEEVVQKKTVKKAIMEFSIDHEVETVIRELIAPTHFTMEQMIAMFVCWCAHYPDEAMCWLKKTAKDQGVVLTGNKGEETPQI